MAKEMGIGQDSIGRIWNTFGVKPHIVNGFKLSKLLIKFSKKSPRNLTDRI